MTVKSNTTTAVTTAGDQTDWVYIEPGNFNFQISGTWTGTITLMRLIGKYRAIGTHTAANGQAGLTDSAATFTADELIGLYVTNDTDGSIAAITDNAATTITGTLAGGTQNDWDTGEVYSVWMPIASYTANTTGPEIGSEEESGIVLMAACTAAMTGTAHIEIRQ